MGPTTIAMLTGALLLGAPDAEGVADRLALGTLSDSEAQVRFDAALRALNDFDDARALQLFSRLLDRDPPVAVAARVHLYLGVIYFNRLETSRAREEFQRAVEIDPAVEPPLSISPKARLAFSEARRKVTAEFARTAAQTSAPRPPPASVNPEPQAASDAGLVAPSGAAADVAPAPPPAPATETPNAPAATQATPEGGAPDAQPAQAEGAPARRSSSHVLTWTLGSVGVAVGAVAVVGLVQVLNYNSVVSNANEHPRTVTSTSVAPAQANAQAWQPWAIGLGIGAAALVVTAGIVW